VFDYGLELGTLLPGSVADISIFEVSDGNFSFSDYPDRSARVAKSCSPRLLSIPAKLEVMDLHS